MKLTEKLKKRINRWFDSRTPEDVEKLAHKHGLAVKAKCPCEMPGTSWCHKHHTDFL